MRLLKYLIVVVIVLISFSNCSSKSTDTLNTVPKTDNAFTAQFEAITLPITIADTTIDRTLNKEKPLKIIGKQYFPDSLIKSFFTEGEKIVYYPIGKVQNEEEEIYILLKAFSGSKKAAFLLCYNNALEYKDGTLLCYTDADSKTSYMSLLKKDFNITIRKTETVLGGDPMLTESFLAYNNAGFLGEVVTNVSEEEMDLTNPIDTLPQKKKYTGDYYADKRNFVSLRDSKDSNELVFFYHYEKGKEECNNEIKGKVIIKENNLAIYLQDGDPCVLLLKFNGNTLNVTEDHGCGNKRALDCTINNTFAKRTNKPTDKKLNEKIKPVITTKINEPTANATTSKPNTIKKKPIPKPKLEVKPITKPTLKQPEIQ